MSNSINNNNPENELLTNWFNDFALIPNKYNEPTLDERTVNFIKHLCETLKQDSYVFILVVDVLEEYIQLKEQQQQNEITEPVVVITTIILICNKLTGVSMELNIEHIKECLYRVTKKHYNSTIILTIEKDILTNLINGQLPMKSILDDMNIVIEKYVQEMRLKVHIQPLCVKILDYLYVIRKKWFFELKQTYRTATTSEDNFKQLISSKFYLPCGILICALQSTTYRNILDLDKLIRDISRETKIHGDHFNVFKLKFFELFQ